MTPPPTSKQNGASVSTKQRTAQLPTQRMRSLLHEELLQETPANNSRLERSFIPNFEVREVKDSYVFIADMCGIRRGNLQVAVAGNQLVINGKRESEKSRLNEFCCQDVRTYEAFSHTTTLSDSADWEKSSADLKDGVLTVRIPKRSALPLDQPSGDTGKA